MRVSAVNPRAALSKRRPWGIHEFQASHAATNAVM